MITKCRICGSTSFDSVLNLGDQALAGAFPKPDECVKTSPLNLLRCTGECGLVQLSHTYDLPTMYGQGYGYRSGLNKSMVEHLESIVENAAATRCLRAGELVVDIGSNDGTTLGFYWEDVVRIGIDPTGLQFKSHYKDGITLIPEFFSAEAVRKVVGDKKAAIITSIAMFYDLDDPTQFMREVASLLADDGIWVTEQSYLPAMMRANAYDTICQEHLSYYSLRQIAYMAERAGLLIVDVEENDTNGGSFKITLSKSGTPSQNVRDMEAYEKSLRLDQAWPYRAFFYRYCGSISSIEAFFQYLHRNKKKVYGLGASTKGNVLLQCLAARSEIGFRSVLQKIGDVNPTKWGKVTPGTSIPIVSEDEALADNPDFLFVLPWHFRENFMANPKFKGRTLIFPLPQLEVVQL